MEKLTTPLPATTHSAISIEQGRKVVNRLYDYFNRSGRDGPCKLHGMLPVLVQVA